MPQAVGQTLEDKPSAIHGCLPSIQTMEPGFTAVVTADQDKHVFLMSIYRSSPSPPLVPKFLCRLTPDAVGCPTVQATTNSMNCRHGTRISKNAIVGEVSIVSPGPEALQGHGTDRVMECDRRKQDLAGDCLINYTLTNTYRFNQSISPSIKSSRIHH